MIYRIRFNQPAREQGQPATERWFVAQIDGRYGYLAVVSLPLEWTAQLGAAHQPVSRQAD